MANILSPGSSSTVSSPFSVVATCTSPSGVQFRLDIPGEPPALSKALCIGGQATATFTHGSATGVSITVEEQGLPSDAVTGITIR